MLQKVLLLLLLVVFVLVLREAQLRRHRRQERRRLLTLVKLELGLLLLLLLLQVLLQLVLLLRVHGGKVERGRLERRDGREGLKVVEKDGVVVGVEGRARGKVARAEELVHHELVRGANTDHELVLLAAAAKGVGAVRRAVPASVAVVRSCGAKQKAGNAKGGQRKGRGWGVRSLEHVRRRNAQNRNRAVRAKGAGWGCGGGKTGTTAQNTTAQDRDRVE